MEIQRCTGCGRMVDQSSRFCRYCGSRLQAPVSQPIHALLGIDPIPFLDGMEQAVLLSSDGTRKTYRVRRFGAPMLLQVVDCGSGSDAVRVFNDGILMLQSLARSGLVAPVRYHLHPDSGKFLGFLLEEDPQATTLKDRFRDNGMTVKEALELVMSLCRALPPLATGRGFLNISPDTVILTGISSGRLSSACVTLTETEQTLYSFSPFAHPESALRGQYLPEAPVWSVAAVLYYLLTGGSYPEKSIGGIPGPAAAIRESTLAWCLDQALRQNCFSSPAQLLTALEEAYRTLTPQQLSRLLFGLAQWGAA